MYLLKSGPGSIDPESIVAVPLDVRIQAVRCLVAIVGSRDTSTVSVLGRFSWLQHELGVNRGQYMGLLPCLLRSTSLYLAGLDHDAPLDPDASSLLSDKDDVEQQERLEWIEMILILTLSLVHSSPALQALTDNGFVALIVTFLQTSPLPAERKSSIRLAVETLLVQCLDTAVSVSRTL